MKKILLSLSLFLATVGFAEAQQTRAQLNATNNADFTTNGVGLITGANLNLMFANSILSFGALSDTNTWTGSNTFSILPAFSSCGTNTFLEGNSTSPLLCVTLGSGVLTALTTGVTGTGKFVLTSSPTMTTPALTGSSTGLTTLTSNNAGATNYTATFPANSGIVPELNFAETWTAVQTFTNDDIAMLGSSTGATTLASANGGATNYTATFPANTGSLAELNLAQSWTAAQTFTNSDILLLGSSTGATTLTSANAGATAYTLTIPANSGTLTELNLAETWTAAQTFTNSDLLLLGSSTGATTFTSANASGTAYTATIPANSGTVAELNLAQSWTAAQTITNSDLLLLGSSTGYTTFTSGNSSSSNYTMTIPANSGTVAELNLAESFTATQTFSGITLTNLAMSSTAPTFTSGACSGAIGTVNGTGAFTFTTGSGSCGSTATIGMPTATTGWICDAVDLAEAGTARIQQTSNSTASVVFTNYSIGSSPAATNYTVSHTVQVKCTGY
jgi:hypothetical protein